MRFTKIAVALLACLALGALAANAVPAAEGDGWTIGATENQTTAGTLIGNGFFEKITCKKHGTSTFELTSTVLGAPLELTAEAVDCVEGKLDNTTSKGHSEGELTLTKVKVLKPANCKVPGEELTTADLTDEVIMDPTAGSATVFDRFFTDKNAKGEETPVTTIILEGTCALAGVEAPVKGTFCGEFVHTNAAGTGYEPNKTGTLTKVQTLLFGKTQQTTGNSAAKPCALKIGAAAAQITGAIDTELSGNNAGKPFGAD